MSMPRERCTCGRPKYNEADLKRWQDEPVKTPDPAWSRDLCWTKPGVRCQMRALTTETT